MCINNDEIKHPGVILKSQLDEICMTNRELAFRVNASEKHISMIINGGKNISPAFAKKLSYVFDMTAADWLKIQADYDEYQLKLSEEENISQNEIQILKQIKEFTDYLLKTGKMYNNCGDATKVLQLRKLLRVSDLTVINQLHKHAAYRVQISDNAVIDPYVLFAWQRLCELETEKIQTASSLDIELLKKSISDIKILMFDKINNGIDELQKIFAKCGIAFTVVKNFRGAPVQGFIKKCDSGKLIMCLTIRRKRADTFWFTLFHEIGHIINGDYSQLFVDFSETKSDIENRADLFARKSLMSDNDYTKFVLSNNYKKYSSIAQFAKTQNVKPYIVIGRLQKEGYLDWSEFNQYIDMYDWVE